MIFRVAAAVFFTTAGAVIGFSLADRLREERKSCGAVGHLFQSASFLIGSRYEDVYGVCRRLKCDSELKGLAFLQNLPDEYKAGENFHLSWKKALDGEKNLASDEKELLYRFGEILGKSDSSSQLSEIRCLQNELESLSELRREALIKKGRLYRVTGVLFGIMAGILVL